MAGGGRLWDPMANDLKRDTLYLTEGFVSRSVQEKPPALYLHLNSLLNYVITLFCAVEAERAPATAHMPRAKHGLPESALSSSMWAAEIKSRLVEISPSQPHCGADLVIFSTKVISHQGQLTASEPVFHTRSSPCLLPSSLPCFHYVSLQNQSVRCPKSVRHREEKLSVDPFTASDMVFLWLSNYF